MRGSSLERVLHIRISAKRKKLEKKIREKIKLNKSHTLGIDNNNSSRYFSTQVGEGRKGLGSSRDRNASHEM